MLQPKRVKYRRPHSLKWEGLSKAGNTVAFGDYGLQATEGEYVSDRQIESARVVLNNFTKRSGKVWIRIFPHMAKTKKPAEVRMGSGKGSPEFWVAVVKINRVMFEIGGVSAKDAIEALRLASFKLPVKTKIIKREVKEVKVVKAAKPASATKVVQEGGK
jgi:large subunit ribosomal protein L16